jgi:hypothetical protein
MYALQKQVGPLLLYESKDPDNFKDKSSPTFNLTLCLAPCLARA